eukprot:3543145-Rhodomonas_salina.2
MGLWSSHGSRGGRSRACEHGLRVLGPGKGELREMPSAHVCVRGTNRDACTSTGVADYQVQRFQGMSFSEEDRSGIIRTALKRILMVRPAQTFETFNALSTHFQRTFTALSTHFEGSFKARSKHFQGSFKAPAVVFACRSRLLSSRNLVVVVFHLCFRVPLVDVLCGWPERVWSISHRIVGAKQFAVFGICLVPVWIWVAPAGTPALHCALRDVTVADTRRDRRSYVT